MGYLGEKLIEYRIFWSDKTGYRVGKWLSFANGINVVPDIRPKINEMWDTSEPRAPNEASLHVIAISWFVFIAKPGGPKEWQAFNRLSVACTLREALTRYLDITSIPTPQMLRYLSKLVRLLRLMRFRNIPRKWMPHVKLSTLSLINKLF